MLQNLQLGDNGCADMVNLSYLHEPTILYNLKQRFSRKIPYTYAGPICIAVNPVCFFMQLLSVVVLISTYLVYVVGYLHREFTRSIS
jgi:hypothetical protein